MNGEEFTTVACCSESVGRIAPFRMLMLMDLGILVPHALEAVTLNVPALAVREKLISTELVVPVMVAPVPE